MKKLSDFSRIPFGITPTPLYKLENISREVGKNIYIKRDDMIGVALGATRPASWSICWRMLVIKGRMWSSPPAAPSPTTPCSPPPVPPGSA